MDKRQLTALGLQSVYSVVGLGDVGRQLYSSGSAQHISLPWIALGAAVSAAWMLVGWSRPCNHALVAANALTLAMMLGIALLVAALRIAA